MNDEQAMLAAYAAHYPDAAHREVLADWLEERGDARAAWLRDPDIGPWMGPDLTDPIARLIKVLPTQEATATRVLVKLGQAAVPALYGALVGEDWELRGVADSISHEAGHTFGLAHQRATLAGGTIDEYYNGGPETVPIMGDGDSETDKRSVWWLTNVYPTQNSPDAVVNELNTLYNAFGGVAPDDVPSGSPKTLQLAADGSGELIEQFAMPAIVAAYIPAVLSRSDLAW